MYEVSSKSPHMKYDAAWRRFQTAVNEYYGQDSAERSWKVRFHSVPPYSDEINLNM
jgi:hypothetical protein